MTNFTSHTPILLGSGEPLFEGIDLPALGYEVAQFAASEKATHLIIRREDAEDLAVLRDRAAEPTLPIEEFLGDLRRRGKLSPPHQALGRGARPTGWEKHSGEEKYRLRQEDFRILYEIVDEELILTVVNVRHRRDVHR